MHAKAVTCKRRCKRKVSILGSLPIASPRNKPSFDNTPSLGSFLLGWTSDGGDYVWYCRRENKADIAIENTKAKKLVRCVTGSLKLSELWAQLQRTLTALSLC